MKYAPCLTAVPRRLNTRPFKSPDFLLPNTTEVTCLISGWRARVCRIRSKLPPPPQPRWRWCPGGCSSSALSSLGHLLRSPGVPGGGCQSPRSRSSCVWTETVGIRSQIQSEQFWFAPRLGAPHALCSYTWNLNCPSDSWAVSCKSLKNCSSLAHLLCHIFQHKVQTIPQYQVDAADQLISVTLPWTCIRADRVWLKPRVSQ